MDCSHHPDEKEPFIGCIDVLLFGLYNLKKIPPLLNGDAR